jgi:hypothetical protein
VDPGTSPEHDAARALDSTWRARCPKTGRYRTRAEIEALLDGLELVPPGLVVFDDWWPDGPSMTAPTPTRRLGLAVVGITPSATSPITGKTA